MVCQVGSETFQNRATDAEPNMEATGKSGMIYGYQRRQTCLAILRQWVHLLTKISELRFFFRKELSLLSDLLYMPTGTGCLSYGHGYVLTAA